MNKNSRKFFSTKTSLERFLLYISNSPHPKGCWMWEGMFSHNGYGRFRLTGGKRIPAHRYSYELFTGKIKKGLLICHTCDNPPCVNPDHLWMGTTKQNIHDMIKKNRGGFGSSINPKLNPKLMKKKKGTEHHRAKLNEEKVKEIRRLHQEGITNRELGIKFNISEYTISGIVLRNEWKHV